jgi:autoinducer 2-degrading protein
MIVVHVALGIRPDGVDAFAAAAAANAAASVLEPGCLRFEVYRVTGEPTGFVLFEIYADQTAREAHWATPHFLAYRDATAALIETRAVTEYEPLGSTETERATTTG